MNLKASLSLAAALVLLSGCRVDFVLDVSMTEDGTSSVMFAVFADEDVVADIDLAEIDLSGVTDSGWRVVGPTTVDGGARLELGLDGVAPDDVAEVVSDLDGGRLFEVTNVEVVPGIGTTRYSVELAALPDVEVEEFSDAALADLLGGAPFGEATADLEALAGGSLDTAVSVTVVASVPGAVAQSASVDLADSEAKTVLVESTATNEAVFDARAEAGEARSAYDRAWIWVALCWAAAALLALLLVVVHRRRKPDVQVPTV